MSFYLKYRPQNFDSLVWQDFIRETLTLALKNNMTVASYLLCGPRGTGKTTTARLLAKWFNCTDLQNWSPCNSCDNCKAFNENSLTDAIEIDAASHNWVDNIRELIDRAQFQPNVANYKVYIIDEVHMLSTGAFNALLKTLEEPPEHVKFILATTETHKVPDTIISRCQRYDFKSITVADIEKRLKFVAKEESVQIDEKSLHYIAKAANWALRNALNLFEQMVQDWKISYEAVEEKLWLIWDDVLQNIYTLLLEKDPSAVIEIQKIIDEWKNKEIFIRDLLYFIQEKLLGDSWDDIWKKVYLLEQIHNGAQQLKNAFDQNIVIQIMVYKIIGKYDDSAKFVSQNKNTVAQKVSQSSTVAAQPTIQVQSAPVQFATMNTQNAKKELHADDVHDIFCNDLTEPVTIEQNIPDTHVQDMDVHFNKEKYIASLKEIWAKWALIIALKQARSFTMTEEHLEIVLENNFTLKMLNTWENILTFIRGLEKMGIKDKSVKLS